VQFINLDDTYNKGGPYTVHNMSGAWNAVTDMTNGGGQRRVVSAQAHLTAARLLDDGLEAQLRRGAHGEVHRHRRRSRRNIRAVPA
jgi:hypothetical protein